MPNQDIHCSVGSCRYNSSATMCTLNSIKVGDMGSHAKAKLDTECDSFEAK